MLQYFIYAIRRFYKNSKDVSFVLKQLVRQDQTLTKPRPIWPKAGSYQEGLRLRRGL